MSILAMFLNKLPLTDIVFFIVCAVIIVAIVAVYFLIPVFNKKQYQEQRDNLRKREEAFKANSKFVPSTSQTDSNEPTQSIDEKSDDSK